MSENILVTYHHDKKRKKSKQNNHNLPDFSEKPVGRESTEV